MPEWLPIVLSFIGGLGGIATLGTWILNWRKARPEIARMYEEMATKQAAQIDELRTSVTKQDLKISHQDRKIDWQEGMICRMRDRLKEWEAGIRILVEQLTTNGLDPAWLPRASEKGNDYEVDGLDEVEGKG